MFCVTESVDPRLFINFEADACVIVRDRKAFAKRLQRGAVRDLGRVIQSMRKCMCAEQLQTLLTFAP